MRIVVCYKYVLDEQDLRVNPETRLLATDRAAWKISDYDRNAIEEAVRIKEEHGATVFALTTGPAAARASLKDALARGADEAYLVQEDCLAGSDPAMTADVLARAVHKIGDCDLILCGEGASDNYNQQVGPRLAVLMGWPAVTYVHQIRLAGRQMTAERKLDDGTEIVAVDLPVVVTVAGDINQPRIPGLKQIMGAGKKPITVLTFADLGTTPDQIQPRLKNQSVKGVVVDRKRQVFKGDPAEAAGKLVDALVREGAV